jgi:hypothetical protein
MTRGGYAFGRTIERRIAGHSHDYCRVGETASFDNANFEAWSFFGGSASRASIERVCQTENSG